MLRTKNADGRTEGRTEGRRDNEAQTYSPPTGGVGTIGVGTTNKGCPTYDRSVGTNHGRNSTTTCT